jgi:hypothetical protein
LATIDRRHLRHNLAQVRQWTGDAKIWAVVKADAYGHGIERVFVALRSAEGFALLDLAEAQRLRVAFRQVHHRLALAAGHALGLRELRLQRGAAAGAALRSGGCSGAWAGAARTGGAAVGSVWMPGDSGALTTGSSDKPASGLLRSMATATAAGVGAGRFAGTVDSESAPWGNRPMAGQSLSALA